MRLGRAAGGRRAPGTVLPGGRHHARLVERFSRPQRDGRRTDLAAVAHCDARVHDTIAARGIVRASRRVPWHS